MLSINKLLLPLLVTSTFVAPVCYANQNAHKTISALDEQLKNQIHHILRSNHDTLGIKKPHQFDTNKTFVLVDDIGTHAGHDSIKYPNHYAQFFKTKGSTFLIYNNFERGTHADITHRIYARIPEQPNQPILFIALASIMEEFWNGDFDDWDYGYTIFYAEFDRTSNTMLVTKPFSLPTVKTSSTYEQDKPNSTEDNAHSAEYHHYAFEDDWA